MDDLATAIEGELAAEPRRVRSAPGLLRAAAVIAAAIALVLAVGAALGRWPVAFDRAVILALHDAGPPGVRRAMVNLTALGSGTVLTLVTLVATGLLLVRRLWLTALLTAGGAWTGSLAVDLLKGVFARARPDIVDHLVEIGGMSFPSGHAASSATVYLTVAGLATQVTSGAAMRRYIVAVAILLVGTIGVSRVYLGVHWPSDVLAGWSFGTLWALGWWWAGAEARASLRR